MATYRYKPVGDMDIDHLINTIQHPTITTQRKADCVKELQSRNPAYIYRDGKVTLESPEEKDKPMYKALILFPETGKLITEVEILVGQAGYKYTPEKDYGNEELLVITSNGDLHYSDAVHPDIDEDYIIPISNEVDIHKLRSILSDKVGFTCISAEYFANYLLTYTSDPDYHTVYPPVEQTPITKETTMASTINKQIDNNKQAAILAAEITAGKVLNKKVVSILKPTMPMMIRGYMDSPLASVALANVVGLALKQYAPNNDKANKVASLMLNASALQLMESFNIEQMLDELLEGIKLPESSPTTTDA